MSQICSPKKLKCNSHPFVKEQVIDGSGCCIRLSSVDGRRHEVGVEHSVGHDRHPGGQVRHKQAPASDGGRIGIIEDKRTQGCRPEGRRGVGDCVVEVDGEGDHVEEEAGQGAEQGEGGEEEGGEGTPEKEIKSHTSDRTKNKKGD